MEKEKKKENNLNIYIENNELKVKRKKRIFIFNQSDKTNDISKYKIISKERMPKYKQYSNIKEPVKFANITYLNELVTKKEIDIDHQNYINILFLIILFILYFPIISSEKIRKTDSIYQITLKVEGLIGSTQNILGETDIPDKVIINEKEKEPKKSYVLEENKNNIILIWNSLPNCSKMFYFLSGIISIDLSNFDSSEVINMSEMFMGCSSLKSINFGNFDTSKVTNMEKMFYNCPNLISLDLSSFITSSVENMGSMFSYSISLISLDLSNFNTSSVIKMDGMFNNLESVIYLNLISFVEKEGVTIDDIFNSEITALNYCINETNSPKIYEELLKRNINNSCENECFQNQKKLIIEKKKCITKCSDDDKYIYELNNICYEYKPNNTNDDNPGISENSENNESTEYSEHVENLETTEIVKDNQSYESESTGNIEHNNEFSSLNFFKEAKNSKFEISPNKDQIIQSIREDIINRNLEPLLLDLINETSRDLIVEYKDISYQLTTIENQKNNLNHNISTIDLGDCEQTLKSTYNISLSLPLIILKIDYYMKGLLIPVIGYEVYHPTNYSQLDLNYCNNSTVKLKIPVSIDEDNLFIYDPNSDFYNDECYAYTTENGIDIILNDRKREYVENNLSLCEDNCTYKGYESINKKALCECETKIKIELISNIINSDNILSNTLNITKSSSTNIATLKCISLLFSKNGLIANIGSYLLIFTITFFCISIIIFLKCGNQLIENKINEIIHSKKVKKNLDIYNISYNSMDKRSSLKMKKKKKKKINNKNKANPKKRQIKIINESGNQNLMSGTKNEYKNTSIIIYSNKNNVNIKKSKSSKSLKRNLIKYRDSELNYLIYNDAIIYDKRSFLKYYYNLNKLKIIFLFAFYPIDDYNIKIIKICIFFLSFILYFAINTFFFNDSTLHQIYLERGKYNFVYFLPNIIYSFLCSYFIIVILKYFCLSESNILEINNMNKRDEINNKVKTIKRCLMIKYIIFFISSFIFLIVFWFYLSSFCAVYKNTQVYLIINTFISVLIGSIYPLLFNILPGVIRIKSLKNNKNERLFKFSKFLQEI